jgi:hypothetical protein
MDDIGFWYNGDGKGGLFWDMDDDADRDEKGEGIDDDDAAVEDDADMASRLDCLTDGGVSDRVEFFGDELRTDTEEAEHEKSDLSEFHPQSFSSPIVEESKDLNYSLQSLTNRMLISELQSSLQSSEAELNIVDAAVDTLEDSIFGFEGTEHCSDSASWLDSEGVADPDELKKQVEDVLLAEVMRAREEEARWCENNKELFSEDDAPEDSVENLEDDSNYQSRLQLVMERFSNSMSDVQPSNMSSIEVLLNVVDDSNIATGSSAMDLTTSDVFNACSSEVDLARAADREFLPKILVL